MNEPRFNEVRGNALKSCRTRSPTFCFYFLVIGAQTCRLDFNTSRPSHPLGAEEAERYNPFPCRKGLQERRLAANQITLIRWYDLSSTLFKASYLHNLTAVLFFPRQLLAMHESQVKCIPFSGGAPRRQKYNYVLQVDSYLQPPSCPRRLWRRSEGFSERLYSVSGCCFWCKCTIVSLKRSRSPCERNQGVNNLCGPLSHNLLHNTVKVDFSPRGAKAPGF